MSGYVRLYRKVDKPGNEWLTHDPLAWSIYTYMIMNAAWGDGKDCGKIRLRPGEVWCSRSFLAKRFTIPKHPVSQSRVQRIINELVIRGLISVSNSHEGVYLVIGHELMSGPMNGSISQSISGSNTSKEDYKEVSKDTDCVGPFFHCKDGFNVQLTKDEYNTVYAHIQSDTEKFLSRLAADSRRPGRPWRCNRVNLAKNIVARWDKTNDQQKKNSTGNGFQKAVDRVQPKSPYREVEAGGLLGVD